MKNVNKITVLLIIFLVSMISCIPANAQDTITDSLVKTNNAQWTAFLVTIFLILIWAIIVTVKYDSLRKQVNDLFGQVEHLSGLIDNLQVRDKETQQALRGIDSLQQDQVKYNEENDDVLTKLSKLVHGNDKYLNEILSKLQVRFTNYSEITNKSINKHTDQIEKNRISMKSNFQDIGTLTNNIQEGLKHADEMRADIRSRLFTTDKRSENNRKRIGECKKAINDHVMKKKHIP